MLKMLNRTRVINPCFISLKDIFYRFCLPVFLATIYMISPTKNSTTSNRSIKFTLLMKLPLTSITDKFVGSCVDASDVNGMLRPLKALNLAKGFR